MQPGDLLDLDITDVAHGGVFIARHEGRVVFVSDAVPGERVRVRLTETAKSSFWRGAVVDVLDASPHRRPHVWAAADVEVDPDLRPGGADFGHIALPHQRELKTRVLLDALERFGGLEQPSATMSGARPVLSERGEVLAEESADATRWRTRVSLHVDDAGRVGPFAARTHRVIEVDDLPLATAEIARVARSLSAPAGRVDLVQPADGRVRVVARPGALRDGRSGSPRRGAGPRRGAQRAVAEDAAARKTVVEEVDGRPFRLDAGGFWQVHRLAAHTLSSAVADVVRDAGGVDPEAQHLDLYGGVGLFAATLAGLGGPATRITTVESDPAATEHAGENLADWIGARAETARTERFLARLQAQAGAAERARLGRGVTLLDPPRAGAGRDVVDAVAALAPASVVYVACDPFALSRDLGWFRERGYDVRRIAAFDLFPHSHHVEAVALLQREP
ncbi:tRNA/tmRNA/rRNA uracil-C5-methylase (TrmA/RlmC/RlmD family) [Microbacterium laevaniformans]|uniref:class I SAM-dependent RNA methyltransferase n=1 Tax=Microbacterium laevaniformans TaxID=36807 RepID=UPI00195E965A|nr:class I SAM-dependent RNA methyltransferase [Microbacterium laevaniformans]MBM7751761.1 tRNA/tmRNA/rRNA uracil-C5-methylase (TrmA/RlmC/RlmD family) [Microbacterium laevaniformans]